MSTIALFSLGLIPLGGVVGGPGRAARSPSEVGSRPARGVRPFTPRAPAHGQLRAGWWVHRPSHRRPQMLTPTVTYLGPAHRLRPVSLSGQLVTVPTACAAEQEASAR